MPITDTLIGALLAGVVGLVTQRVAIWIRERNRRERWRNRLVRLCRRLVWDVEEDDDDEIKYALYSFLDVQPLLEEHLADTPETVPDEVLEHYENIFELKKHYGSRAHASRNGQARHVKEMSEEAKQIIQLMEDR